MAPVHGGPPDEIRVWWKGRDLGPASPSDRHDLDRHLYWISSPRTCGFVAAVPEPDPAGRLEVVARRHDRDLAWLATTFVAPQLESAPLPPPSLTERVSDLSGDSFRLSGLQTFTDMWDQTSEYAADPRSLAVLDWGCGCGRISRYLAWAGAGRLLGCDIDAKAVAWCAANLPGDFRRSGPEPPLPFADSEADVVFASSVFTHLDEEHQQRWLEELRRVLAPGGLLIASVAGEYSFMLGRSRFLGVSTKPGSLRGRAVALRRRLRLRRAGTMSQDDPHLDGIAPPGYYKMVFTTRDFVARAWTRHFTIESYIEQGLAGHQDLVVMRPR